MSRKFTYSIRPRLTRRRLLWIVRLNGRIIAQETGPKYKARDLLARHLRQARGAA